MHELGLVNYVVREVSRIAEENQVRKLHSVTLEFGEVSGIVPSYLHSYWDWYTKKFPLFEGTELICETVPAITWCDDCKKTYPTVEHGKTCHNAQGFNRFFSLLFHPYLFFSSSMDAFNAAIFSIESLFFLRSKATTASGA